MFGITQKRIYRIFAYNYSHSQTISIDIIKKLKKYIFHIDDAIFNDIKAHPKFAQWKKSLQNDSINMVSVMKEIATFNFELIEIIAANRNKFINMMELS
jgi:hypothetical protein